MRVFLKKLIESCLHIRKGNINGIKEMKSFNMTTLLEQNRGCPLKWISFIRHLSTHVSLPDLLDAVTDEGQLVCTSVFHLGTNPDGVFAIHSVFGISNVL